MTFAGIWSQVHPSLESSNSLPTHLTSLVLVLLFRSHNFLLKSFITFVTDFAEVFWEKIQVWLRKVDLQIHIASHTFVRSQWVLHNILIVRCFVISLEVLADPLKWQPCISFSPNQVSIKLLVLHQFPDLGSYKYTFLDFCITHNCELIPQIFESMAGFIQTFHKVFHEAQLYVQRGAEKFSPEEQEEDWWHFSPLVSVMFIQATVYLHSDSSCPSCSTHTGNSSILCTWVAFKVTVSQPWDHHITST